MLRTRKKSCFEYTNENEITEEVPKHVHQELDNNFPEPKMNSGFMTIHHNDPEIFIDDPEKFHQYRS